MAYFATEVGEKIKWRSFIMDEFKQKRLEYIRTQVRSDLFRFSDYDRAVIVQRIRDHLLDNTAYWAYYHVDQLKTLLDEIIEVNKIYRECESK
jgi:hypothetical protein